MASKLQSFGKWLGNKRPFRADWFAKDPQQALVPEEALFNMPEPLAEKLVAAANRLPIPPTEKQRVMDELKAALTSWRARPQASANSLVVLADPVSAVSRILASSLQSLREESDKAQLTLNILDWVERPAKVSTIKQQIQQQLNLSEADQPVENGDAPFAQSAGQSAGQSAAVTPDKDLSLMVLPNLCWCFLRSADGLDGLDYLQDLLPRDRTQFWVIGSGIVGWEYLNSTLKFDAYCGKTIPLPVLSGKDLQTWLSPLVESFDIHFPESALHKRLQSSQNLFDLNFNSSDPVAAFSDMTQEVSASVQASARTLKDEFFGDASVDENDTPRHNFFERLADISDGVSEVALQLFIKSLRYRQIEEREHPAAEDDQTEVVLKETSAPDSKKERIAKTAVTALSGDRDRKQSNEKDHCNKKDYRLIAVLPKLPPLPDLSQSDLYLLYSLMLHGDMTVKALSKSLGDAPNVVTSQVQVLRGAGVIEQKGSVLKVNPVHYPRARRELAKNNFIIEVP